MAHDIRTPRLNRRSFLKHVGASAGSVAAAGSMLGPLGRHTLLAAAADRPKVAAVITSFTYRSHAHVILENFLQKYLFNGQVTDPGAEVVSMYIDQTPSGDMSRDVARQYNLPVYPTIAQALCVGGDKLAVDAVLSIGEHGSYPVNDKGQMEYPRKRFFDEIAAVCRTSGRGVALFNDKHLSYRWDWAKEMVDVSRELGMPLMAGSSVPLAQRRPALELPEGAKIVDAVSIHGGGVESYDFHGLEVLQSFVEARRGGETGVSRVEFLDGEPLWKAADEGRWSIPLAQAAMAAEVGADHELTQSLARRGKSPSGNDVRTHAILVTYKDGLHATMLKVGDSGTRWNFACRLDGETAPRATSIYVGPWQNRALFRALSHAIQTHFRQRSTPYPAERTLLTTGVLAAAMDSRHDKRPVDTPHLELAYQPRDFRAMREMGDTWKILTEDLPEEPGIHAPGR